MLEPRQKLLHMANQIADFFRPYSEEEAVAGIHDHILNFWTPGMRKEFRIFVQEETEAINPRIVQAMHLFDANPPSPVDKATASATPAEGGEAASDAG
jgi:formate dehydrogenase subunit delta